MSEQTDWLTEDQAASMRAQLSYLERRETFIQRRDASLVPKDDWVTRAARYLALYSGVRHRFLIEDAAEAWASEGREAPADKRWWGRATQLAKKRGHIVACGYGPARTSNGSPKVLWRRA